MKTLGKLRLMVVAASVAVILSVLTACGSDEAGSGEGDRAKVPTDAKVEGTLSFWLVQGPATKDFWKPFIADFESQHPGATIEITEYPSDQYFGKTLAAFSSGGEPDVFSTNSGELLNRFVRVGKIAALNDLVKFNRYYNKATLSPFTAPNGDIIGTPLFLYVISLWRNEDLLAEHNLQPPETWAELLDACGTLSSSGVTPIALGNRGTDAWTSALWMDTLLYQFGGANLPVDATFGDGETTWEDPAVVSAAERFKELVDANCFPKGFAGLSYSQMQALFTRGDAALSLDGSWFAQEFGKGGGEFAVGVGPVPDAPDAGSSTTSLEGIIGGSEGLAASRKAGEEKPALVAAFLNAVAESADDYANSQSALSVAASPMPSGNALQKTLSDMLGQVQELTLSTDLRIPSALHDDYYQTIQALLSGDVTPEELGTRIADAVDEEKPNFDKLQ